MSTKSNNTKLLIMLLNRYHIKGNEKKELVNIIKPIYLHPEFQKRFESSFPHHGSVTVAEHLIEDTIKTYLLSKIYIMKKKNKNYDIKSAIYIAIFHDLYTVPWQNNSESKVVKFQNVHGFRHPVEAVINAYNWFPQLFNDDNYVKIIDGIVHHMYPLPVISINSDLNTRELKNYELYRRLPNKIKNALIMSTKRNCIFGFSLAKSKYVEGRIMSRADKYVSIKQLKSIYDWIALLTGKNKRLTK